MKKAALLLIAILGLALIPTIGEESRAEPEFTEEYVTVTYYVDGESIATVGMIKGHVPIYIPSVPDGYTGWDKDLTQPVYEDMIVNAIPEESTNMWLFYCIAFVIVVLMIGALGFYIAPRP